MTKTTLKTGTSLLLLVGLAMTAFAIAGEQHHDLRIVLTEEGDGEPLRIELSGDELGFGLNELAEGESRAVVDRDGRNILITREREGFRFDVEGRTVHMPAVPSHGSEKRIEHRVMMHPRGPEHGPGDIMILSAEPIDSSTQDAIRSLLASAGHDSDVHFIDHRLPPGGPHRVKIIEKQVDERSSEPSDPD